MVVLFRAGTAATCRRPATLNEEERDLPLPAWVVKRATTEPR